MSLRLAFHFQFLFEPVAGHHLQYLSQWFMAYSRRDWRRRATTIAVSSRRPCKCFPILRRYKKSGRRRRSESQCTTISPWVLVGELAQARAKLLEALQEYPLSGRLAWVRSRVRWVAHQLLVNAASPLSEARDLCSQIEGVTGGGGGVRERRYTRWILAEIWADVFMSNDLRRRVGRRGAAYAAARALTYAPTNVLLALRMGRSLLKR